MKLVIIYEIKSSNESTILNEINFMYKNKNNDGTLNLSGQKIKELRKNLIPKTSQRLLAEKLQLMGIDLDKNAIQKIEVGQRFITDIELLAFANFFEISVDELIR